MKVSIILGVWYAESEKNAIKSKIMTKNDEKDIYVSVFLGYNVDN